MHTNTWGTYNLLSTIFSCYYEILAKRISLPHHFFSLISALYRLIIFFSIKRCGILSFISHYPVHISIDMRNNFFFFIQLRSDVFSEHSFNFLSSVLIHWCKFCIYITVGIRGSMKSTAHDSIMLLFLTFRTTSMAF